MRDTRRARSASATTCLPKPRSTKNATSGRELESDGFFDFLLRRFVVFHQVADGLASLIALGDHGRGDAARAKHGTTECHSRIDDHEARGIDFLQPRVRE